MSKLKLADLSLQSFVTTAEARTRMAGGIIISIDICETDYQCDTCNTCDPFCTQVYNCQGCSGNQICPSGQLCTRGC